MNWTSSFLVQSDELVDRSALASRSCRSSSKADSGGGVAMLSAESQVQVVLGLWKNKGLTRELLVFSELLVFGEVLVILVLSMLLGLITCRRIGA